MRQFKDNAGRQWEVAVNVATVKRVRDVLAVDLLTVLDDDGKLLDRLADDPVFLVDVLYVLCSEQAKGAGVTDEQFGQAMAGQAIDAAATALLEDLADFFPAARRTVLGRAIAKLRALEERQTAFRVAILDGPELDTLVDRQMREAWEQARGRWSGNAPGSSASTPGPAPCGN
jgi:hypothetical protein